MHRCFWRAVKQVDCLEPKLPDKELQEVLECVGDYETLHRLGVPERKEMVKRECSREENVVSRLKG